MWWQFEKLGFFTFELLSHFGNFGSFWVILTYKSVNNQIQRKDIKLRQSTCVRYGTTMPCTLSQHSYLSVGSSYLLICPLELTPPCSSSNGQISEYLDSTERYKHCDKAHVLDMVQICHVHSQSIHTFPLDQLSVTLLGQTPTRRVDPQVDHVLIN